MSLSIEQVNFPPTGQITVPINAITGGVHSPNQPADVYIALPNFTGTVAVTVNLFVAGGR